MSLRDDILGCDDLKYEDVQVPEWGGCTVRIREMTGAERDRYEALILDNQDKPLSERVRGTRARLVLYAACDPETDERLFNDEDVEALNKKSATVMTRLATVAQKLSRLTDADIEEASGN